MPACIGVRGKPYRALRLCVSLAMRPFARALAWEQITSSDVDEVNAIRRLLSVAVGLPSSEAGPGAPRPSPEAVQGRLLSLLRKQRDVLAQADVDQASSALAVAWCAVREGGEGDAALDPTASAAMASSVARGVLLPPILSPLYDYSPEEMGDFR